MSGGEVHGDRLDCQAETRDECDVDAHWSPDQPTVPAPGPTRAAEGLRGWATKVLRFYDAERERTRQYGDHDQPLADTSYHQGYQQAMRDLLWRSAALAEAAEGEGEAGAAGLTDEADLREQTALELLRHMGWTDEQIDKHLPEPDHAAVGCTPWNEHVMIHEDQEGVALHPLHDEMAEAVSMAMATLDARERILANRSGCAR